MTGETAETAATPTVSSFADTYPQTDLPACPYFPEADCYAAIVEQITKLEQALAHTTLAPPTDLVLEAEKDLTTQRRRLFACAGHSFQRSCLASGRPVLLNFARLAERLLGLFEDVYRQSLKSLQKMDKNHVTSMNHGTPDVVPSSSARRLRRSCRRPPVAPPCASPALGASCELCIEALVVEDKAKSVAIMRILKLRMGRILGELKALASTREWTTDGWGRRSQRLDGSEFQAGYAPVLGNTAYAMIDDVIRRAEELHRAMLFDWAGRAYKV